MSFKPTVGTAPSFSGFVYAKRECLDNYINALNENRKAVNQVKERPLNVAFYKNKASIRYYNTKYIAECNVIKEHLLNKYRLPLESVNHFVKRVLSYVLKNEEKLEARGIAQHKAKGGFVV